VEGSAFRFVILSGVRPSRTQSKDLYGLQTHRVIPTEERTTEEHFFGVIPTGAQRSGGTCFSFVILSGVRQSRTQSKDLYDLQTHRVIPTEEQTTEEHYFLVSSRPERSAAEGPAFRLSS
jgi:hypothetical protein